MPYIKQEDRYKLDTLEWPPCSAGELNYGITRMIKCYLHDRGISYQTMNDIVGALEGAKLEFYARVVRPYEDEKIAENGDVYN